MLPKKIPPTPIPSAVASPSRRDRLIALRATSTKLGPGIIAPKRSATRMANTAAAAVIGVSPNSAGKHDRMNASCRRGIGRLASDIGSSPAIFTTQTMTNALKEHQHENDWTDRRHELG